MTYRTVIRLVTLFPEQRSQDNSQFGKLRLNGYLLISCRQKQDPCRVVAGKLSVNPPGDLACDIYAISTRTGRRERIVGSDIGNVIMRPAPA